MKLKLNQNFKNLKNEIIKSGNQPLMLGEVLAEIIIAPNQKKGFRVLKALELSRRFYVGKEIEIDKSDLAQLKEIVEDNKTYVPLITGQILETLLTLEDLKEDK